MIVTDGVTTKVAGGEVWADVATVVSDGTTVVEVLPGWGACPPVQPAVHSRAMHRREIMIGGIGFMILKDFYVDQTHRSCHFKRPCTGLRLCGHGKNPRTSYTGT